MSQNINYDSEIKKVIFGTFYSDRQSLQQKITNSGWESLPENEKKKYMILNDVLTEGSDRSLHAALVICFPTYAKFYTDAINSSSTSSSKVAQEITTAKEIHEKLLAREILTNDEKKTFFQIIRICIQPLITDFHQWMRLHRKIAEEGINSLNTNETDFLKGFKKENIPQALINSLNKQEKKKFQRYSKVHRVRFEKMSKKEKDIVTHNFLKEINVFYLQFYDQIMSSSNNRYEAKLRDIFGKLDEGESLTNRQHNDFWYIIEYVQRSKKNGITTEKAFDNLKQQLNRRSTNQGLSSEMTQTLSSTSNEKAGTPVSSNRSLSEKQKQPSRKRPITGDSSNFILMEDPESSSRKKPRARDSFDMSSGGKQKSSSTTTANKPLIQKEIKQKIRPVVSAIKEMVTPYTLYFSIQELNSMIVQEVVLNSSQQPSNMRQRSSYSGPYPKDYSTTPPVNRNAPPFPPYYTGPQPNGNTMRGGPPMLYYTGPQPNRNPMTGGPPMSYYTGPQPNRNPMTGGPPMPYNSRAHLNRNTMMRSHPPQAGRNPMTDSNNAPPNMKKP